MPNTILPSSAQFGGEAAFRFGVQPDAITPATSLSPAGFVNIPGITNAADMDKIFPLGTYQRQQNNLMNVRPALSFRQDIQDIALLAAGLRDANGHLSYYTFDFGTPDVARRVIGAKTNSVKINMPRDGRLSVEYGLDAMAVQALTTAPAAMTYSATKVYYGYGLTLSTGGNDYTQFFTNITAEIQHTLVRLMPRLYNSAGDTSSANYFLRSQGLKETIQTIMLRFDLYQPLSLQQIEQVCRNSFSVECLFLEPCSQSIIRITLSDVQFSTDNLSEGDMQSILSFTAEADARNIVIANV